MKATRLPAVPALTTLPANWYRLEDMRSACPTVGVQAHNRADPFWHGLWLNGAHATWLSRATAERRVASGLGRLHSADRQWTPQTADAALRSGHGATRQRRLAALSAVGLWRTATDQQVRAITGDNGQAGRQQPSSLKIAWTARVVDRGEFMSGMAGMDLPRLYRPLDSNASIQLFKDLPFRERAQVTAGFKWAPGPRHDRHNLLSTELALRIAEFCEIGTVLGETVCGLHLLDPAGPSLKRTSAAADLAAVRVDGLRFAFELTTNRSPGFEAKVRRWAELLMRHDLNHGGLIAVFVEAGDPDDPVPDRVWHDMQNIIAKVLATTPGAARARLGERLAIARWKDWFPAAGVATRGFRTLRCERPCGPASDRWQETHPLDLTDLTFDPPNPAKFHEVLTNANSILGVPHWLRTGPVDDFGALLRRRAGITGRDPVLPRVPVRAKKAAASTLVAGDQALVRAAVLALAAQHAVDSTSAI